MTLETSVKLCYNKDDGKEAFFQMPIQYKIDVIAKLKEAGYNTSKIRKEKIMGEAMLQKIRSGQMVSWATLETICDLLSLQPGDIIEFVKEDGPEAE